MGLILIIVLLLVLSGGGFGYYRGGCHRRGGPVGFGGIRVRSVQTSASVGCAERLRRAAGAALLVIAATFFAGTGTAVSATAPDAGAWFVDGTGAALQIFNCSGLLCGRIVWPQNARDTAGRPASDNNNPDPASRRRRLCGLTVLRGLCPVGPDHWNSGSLYNPDEGGHTLSRPNSARPMYSSRAYMSACRCSERPRPCCGSRG
jgi:hypothetical protein